MTVDRDTQPGESVDTPTDEQLAARISELESAISELRNRTMRPPRGPLGLPRPPTPREFVEFTDDYAVPTTIAFLQANIRTLQAFQAALRLVRGTDEMSTRTVDARERTVDLGAKTLDALDSALDDLKDVYQEGTLPDNPDSRSILDEAQRLTDEIRDELRATTDTRRRTDMDSTRASGETTRDPRVDPNEVETELNMLRDQFETTKIDVEGPTDEDHNTDETNDTEEPSVTNERTGTDQSSGAGETNSVDGRSERADTRAGTDLDDDRDEADVSDEFFEDDEDGGEDGSRGGEDGPEYGER